MKRRRKAPAPKVANGHVVRPGDILGFVPRRISAAVLDRLDAAQPRALRYPSCKPLTDLDREFGPWVRVGNQWVRAKRR